MGIARKTIKKSGVSNEAVLNKTGKEWKEWFSILDKAKAGKLNHREIVIYLKENFKISPWWQQMVAGTYEKEKGLREKHEMPDGFQISKSKTFAIPVEQLYTVCTEKKLRKLWMTDFDLKIRKSNPNKSIRMNWNSGNSIVEFQFYSRNENKAQLTIQQSKLPNKIEAERMKKYWTENLDKLKLMLKK